MKHSLPLICVLALLVLLVSCVPTPQETAPEQQTVVVVEDEPIQKTVSRRSSQPAASEPGDNALTTLLSKNADAQNYYYLFDANKAGGYYVSAYGSKIKKEYSDTIRLNNEFSYNKVFLDTSTKKAIAICDKGGITCRSVWNKAQELPYEMQKIYPSPVDIARGVRSPKKIGTQVLQERETTIIDYWNGQGMKERLYVDNYYGLPLKQVILGDDGSILEEHLFTQLSVGHVTEGDVILPQKYVVE